MEIIFHSHANKTHFHKKGCAPILILKVRVFGTRKRPIAVACVEGAWKYWAQERTGAREGDKRAKIAVALVANN